MFRAVTIYQTYNFMDNKEFEDFFKPYSGNVDKANSLAFWKLSDEIITEVIKKHIPAPLDESKVILDAGGGTGRWICDLSKIYKSKFILYDRSSDMLKVASKNIDVAGITPRVKIIQGDFIDMAQIPSDSVDYVISVYSPISFVYEKEKAANELWRVMKKGGILTMMGHGFYNAIASKINNYMAPAGELAMISNESMVKWGDSVPKLNLFSKELMEGMLSDAGFNIVETYGVPVFIQPGPEDFDPTNSKKSRISEALESRAFYSEVLRMEMAYNNLPEVSNRGMNIFTAVRK